MSRVDAFCLNRRGAKDAQYLKRPNRLTSEVSLLPFSALSAVLIFDSFSACADFSGSERCLHSEPARRQTASAAGADALQHADRPKSYRRGAMGRSIQRVQPPSSSFRGFLASRFPSLLWLRLSRAAPPRFELLGFP